jgi:hypothetical protein
MTGGFNQDVVYFTFVISCDVLPTNLISWIMVEWMRAGGVGLYWKEIQAFNAYLPFVIFYLYRHFGADNLGWNLLVDGGGC